MIRLQNIFKASLQDVLKMSWRRLEDVLRTFLQDVLKTSWKRLEDILARRLEDVLKTYGQDEYIGLDQDVLKTSSEDEWLRRIYSSWSRRLEDVLKTCCEDEDERRLQDAFKASSSRRKFAGNLLIQYSYLTHWMARPLRSWDSQETPAQVFSCKFCEISKNTFFTEHLRTAASIRWISSTGICVSLQHE